MSKHPGRVRDTRPDFLYLEGTPVPGFPPTLTPFAPHGTGLRCLPFPNVCRPSSLHLSFLSKARKDSLTPSGPTLPFLPNQDACLYKVFPQLHRSKLADIFVVTKITQEFIRSSPKISLLNFRHRFSNPIQGINCIFFTRFHRSRFIFIKEVIF